MRFTFNILLISIFVLNQLSSVAQTWNLDTQFNTFGTLNERVSAVCLQPDGKILLGGIFTHYYRTPSNGLIRLNADGTVDPTFSIGNADYRDTYCITLQSSGKILVAGSKVVRLNSNGSLDNSFTSITIGSTGAQLHTMFVQADDKIVVGGTFKYTLTPASPINPNPGYLRNIIRLNSNGTFDATFQVGNGVNHDNGKICVIKSLSNGQLMIGGYFTQFNGFNKSNLIKLNADGSLDNGFNPVYPNNYVLDIEVVEADSLLVAGYFTSYNNTNVKYLMKIDAQDGTLSNSFSSHIDNAVFKMVCQMDGKIIVFGKFDYINSTYANKFARLNPNGSIDPSFVTTSKPNFVGFSFQYDLAIQPDGKILFANEETSYRYQTVNFFTRINADGSVDEGFQQSKGTDAYPRVIRKLPNGKYLLGGSFVSYNNTKTIGIVRINQDASLDNTFVGSNSLNDEVYDIELQSNNKIIVAGKFTGYGSTTAYRIARLHEDGNLDASFDSENNFLNNTVFDACLQSDGKIVVGGRFTAYYDQLNFPSGISRNRIARLNSNGTLDASFDPGTGANHFIYHIAIQSDNKIIIGGQFTTYNNVSANYLARLHSDGSLDNGFNIGSGFDGPIQHINLLPNGQMLISGSFSSFNGQAMRSPVRLHSDGSLDPTFHTGSGPITGNYTEDGHIAMTHVRSDGKIFAAGNFTTFHGEARKNLVLLNNDGTVDLTFNANISGAIANFSMDGNNSMLVSAFRGICDDYSVTNFFRLKSSLVDGILSNENDDQLLNATISPNPSSSGERCLLSFNPPQPNTPVQVSLIHLNGNTILKESFIGHDYIFDLKNLPRGIYICTINFDSGQRKTLMLAVL
ncbi:MAG: delta-60 repeat domain-containing protein [Cytophagaceae bacterium]|jgi:uncharacterized delta-60 repeat protein|nr:delta-60 repeat domain-containing protein [Cytophagaceae bacterium]